MMMIKMTIKEQDSGVHIGNDVSTHGVGHVCCGITSGDENSLDVSKSMLTSAPLVPSEAYASLSSQSYRQMSQLGPLSTAKSPFGRKTPPEMRRVGKTDMNKNTGQQQQPRAKLSPVWRIDITLAHLKNTTPGRSRYSKSQMPHDTRFAEGGARQDRVLIKP